MKESMTFSPPNSLILVMDHAIGVLPDQITAELVAITDTCLAIGTLSASDGETTVTLTDDLDGLEVGKVVFDGALSTPNHELSVSNVLNQKLLTMPVATHLTKVKVFANDVSEPDQIVIFVKGS
ncbi:MAG TPA: hypothetical protein VJ806_16565 [Luteimonas sp.]|nr:hypothetical protein [Luteimonas sp.]